MPNLVKTFLKRLTRTVPDSLNAIILVSLAVRKNTSLGAWPLVVSVLVPLKIVVHLTERGPTKAAERRLRQRSTA